jgi:hypothetical protein
MNKKLELQFPDGLIALRGADADLENETPVALNSKSEERYSQTPGAPLEAKDRACHVGVYGPKSSSLLSFRRIPKMAAKPPSGSDVAVRRAGI